MVEKYHNWLNKQPTAPIAGSANVSQFQQEQAVGPRAIKKLQETEGGGTPVVAANLDMEYDPKYDAHPNEFGRDRTDVHPEDPHQTPLNKGYSVPQHRQPQQRLNQKTALTAEPGFIWSKNPSTTKIEYHNRLGAGHHPDDVFKQIIGEIADHYTTGQINNRDAHRAANEALGRYMEAKKTRKQAWSGWGPEQKKSKQHKVSGWNWDEYQNGYISNKPRLFECSCGEPVKVPDYHNCKCGKIWNTYVIGTGGDKHQAAAEKYIAREIPARKDVVVASRGPHTPRRDPQYNRPLDRSWTDHRGKPNQLVDLQHGDTPEEDAQDAFDLTAATDHFHSDQGYAGPMKMKTSFPPSEYNGDNCATCGAHFLEPHIGHDPANNKWGKSLQQQPYSDYDKALNDWEHQDENTNVFPTNHHPKVKSTTKGTNAKDWHRRDHTTQQWTST